MASNTPNLNLLKKDPVTDGNDTFNIRTMLNENWDKIDAAVGDMDIPDASLTVKGKVQLSSATDSSAEDKAATPKAVKDVALEAKSYTDQQINLVTETGIPKLVSYPLKVIATVDNQTVFEIPLDLFDANTDTLLVAINRAALDPTQYTVTNTVRNGVGEVTQRAKITLISGVAATSEVTMVVLKNVPLGEDGMINGAVLAVDSLPINRVNGLQGQLDEAFQAGNKRKAEVVAALVAMGISASTSETWDSLIAKMATVIRATGEATAADVLVGKTASNTNGPFIGTIPDRGAGDTITPGTANITKLAGRYTTDIIVKGDPNLVAGNWPDDVSLFGVMGALKRMTPADRNAIINAIVSKGVAAVDSDSNAQLAAKISNITATNIIVGSDYKAVRDFIDQKPKPQFASYDESRNFTIVDNSRYVYRVSSSGVLLSSFWALVDGHIINDIVVPVDGSCIYILSNVSTAYFLTKYTNAGSQIWQVNIGSLAVASRESRVGCNADGSIVTVVGAGSAISNMYNGSGVYLRNMAIYGNSYSITGWDVSKSKFVHVVCNSSLQDASHDHYNADGSALTRSSNGLRRDFSYGMRHVEYAWYFLRKYNYNTATV